MYQNLDLLFERLAQSRFRSRQQLDDRDRTYLSAQGLDKISAHAADIIARRLAPAFPVRDGKQTPWHGHPVFTAQHATATCCRGCLQGTHAIPKGRPLTDAEQVYVVRVIQAWLERQLATAPAGSSQLSLF